jgi:hypothetical protein
MYWHVINDSRQVWIGNWIIWTLKARNYKYYSAIANSHTPQFTAAYTKSSQFVESSLCCWVTSFQQWTFLCSQAGVYLTTRLAIATWLTTMGGFYTSAWDWSVSQLLIADLGLFIDLSKWLACPVCRHHIASGWTQQKTLLPRIPLLLPEVTIGADPERTLFPAVLPWVTLHVLIYSLVASLFMEPQCSVFSFPQSPLLHMFSLPPRAVVEWCHSKPCALEGVVGRESTALCLHQVRSLCWKSTHGRFRELVTSLLLSLSANVNAGIVPVRSCQWACQKVQVLRIFQMWSPCHWSDVTVSIKSPSTELWPYGASHQLPNKCCSFPAIHEEQMMHMTDWDIVTWSHS